MPERVWTKDRHNSAATGSRSALGDSPANASSSREKILDPGDWTPDDDLFGNEGAPRRRSLAILLVEDDEVLASALAAGLKDCGHDVQTESNGALALQRLLQDSFDAVITDLMMPCLGGFQLYREALQCCPELRRRFVFITGNPTDAPAERLRGLSVPLLDKPFVFDDLIQAVEEVALA